MQTLNVSTDARTQLIPITETVQKALTESGISNGICTVYCPHTTAAITINENTDPDVARDILHAVDKLIPFDDPSYRHSDGNSAAHLKACFFGASEQISIVSGRLALGVWQGIYFCEFDGPRSRKIHVQLIPA
jgi:secondary thiamine-phosphate synthase enzyme